MPYSDNVAHVQVCNPHVTANGELGWYTLWATNEHSKAIKNASKRSKQYPNLVFRASYGSSRTLSDMFFNTYRGWSGESDKHQAVYFVAGEKQEFQQPTDYNVNAKDTRHDMWRRYMGEWVWGLIEKAGQQVAEITVETYSESTCHHEGGWKENRQSGMWTTVLAFDHRLNNKAISTYDRIGKDLTRVTINVPGEETIVRYFRYYEEISTEQAESYVQSSVDHAAYKQRRILKNDSVYVGEGEGATFGGWYHLKNKTFAQALQHDSLDRVANAVIDAGVDLEMTASYGQVSEDQASRLRRASALMEQVASILRGDE